MQSCFLSWKVKYIRDILNFYSQQPVVFGFFFVEFFMMVFWVFLYYDILTVASFLLLLIKYIVYQNTCCKKSLPCRNAID